MSTSLPRSAAISHSSFTLAAPSAMVRSKCGMPPTTSTPMSSARFRLSTPPWRAQYAVLREGDQLQVDVGRHALLDLQQRLHRQQAGVAGVDVAADRQQALGDRPVAVGEGAFDDVLGLERGLELAPQLDALQQRAAFVDARLAVGERGVHVEVRIAKGRGEQVAAWRRWFRAAGAERPGVTSVMRPSCTATDMPVRPSGREALVMRRSSMGSRGYLQ